MGGWPRKGLRVSNKAVWKGAVTPWEIYIGLKMGAMGGRCVCRRERLRRHGANSATPPPPLDVNTTFYQLTRFCP